MKYSFYKADCYGNISWHDIELMENHYHKRELGWLSTETRHRKLTTCMWVTQPHYFQFVCRVSTQRILGRRKVRKSGFHFSLATRYEEIPRFLKFFGPAIFLKITVTGFFCLRISPFWKSRDFSEIKITGFLVPGFWSWDYPWIF